jgi:hypothetical protein
MFSMQAAVSLDEFFAPGFFPALNTAAVLTSGIDRTRIAYFRLYPVSRTYWFSIKPFSFLPAF